jgi:uncharacterized protein (DUF2267 family)
MSAAPFYRRVVEETGLPLEAAKRATPAVLHALRDRLTPREADQLAAQLPREIRAAWNTGNVAGRRPVKIRRPAFYARVRVTAGLASTREARALTVAVFAALKAQVSPGEGEDVRAQLPKDLKTLWEDA